MLPFQGQHVSSDVFPKLPSVWGALNCAELQPLKHVRGMLKYKGLLTCVFVKSEYMPIIILTNYLCIVLMYRAYSIHTHGHDNVFGY